MQKIPTLFVRDDKTRKITPAVTPGCEWVLAGDGMATRKYDGTCVLVRGGKMFKRREIKGEMTQTVGADGKPEWGFVAPDGFEFADVDERTGKAVGWVPVGDGTEDRWHRETWQTYVDQFGGLPDGTYELVGPKIQGNPEGFKEHALVIHGQKHLPDCPRDFDGIREYLATRDIEGVVFHHHDGRMAKVKKKDYGLSRKPKVTPCPT